MRRLSVWALRPRRASTRPSLTHRCPTSRCWIPCWGRLGPPTATSQRRRARHSRGPGGSHFGLCNVAVPPPQRCAQGGDSLTVDLSLYSAALTQYPSPQVCMQPPMVRGGQGPGDSIALTAVTGTGSCAANWAFLLMSGMPATMPMRMCILC